MMKKDIIKKICEEKPNLRKYLFVRGFLMTDAALDQNAYPFYGTWNSYIINQYHVLVHPDQKFYSISSNGVSIFMIGHAYNPFKMQIDEKEILKEIAENSPENRFKLINELTGVFTLGWIENRKLTLLSDCASMQIAYYGYIQNHLYVSTHMQLIGDLCELAPSKYVQHLTQYRFYRYYGASLPGDISSYEGVFRIVPNTTVTYDQGTFVIDRFYPKKKLTMCNTDDEYSAKIALIADIMRRNMELISRKWKSPAISLSGGMDSKGSLAAANGIYNKYTYFSYISMPGEQIDADAAHNICQAIGVKHQIDKIDDRNEAFDSIQDFRAILEHNFGNIGANNANDVRKRVYYTQPGHCSFDIEAKSWVSEIGRANYYKKFGLKKMPARLSPRQMSTMYKLFLHDRKLLKETDGIFQLYIQKTAFDNIYNFDASDMYLWEMRYGGWGGQVITCEHRFAFDITIPYNNRILMEHFLTLPLKKRISDQAHYDMIRHLNPTIDQTGITITNYNETRSRMYKERIYWLVNTHLPF